MNKFISIGNQMTNYNQGSSEQKKKKTPIYILIVVAIFLIAFVFYMLADKEPNPNQLPVDTSIPATKDDSSQAETKAENSAVENTTTAIAEDKTN